MLSGITPMLETVKFDETVKFWTDVLGFECAGFQENFWAKLSRDNVSIMFATPNAHRNFEKPKLTGSVYIFTDQVNKDWNNLKDKVKVSYEIESFDYGMREFAFEDPNGYLIQYGQDVDTLEG